LCVYRYRAKWVAFQKGFGTVGVRGSTIGLRAPTLSVTELPEDRAHVFSVWAWAFLVFLSCVDGSCPRSGTSPDILQNDEPYRATQKLKISSFCAYALHLERCLRWLKPIVIKRLIAYYLGYFTQSSCRYQSRLVSDKNLQFRLVQEKVLCHRMGKIVALGFVEIISRYGFCSLGRTTGRSCHDTALSLFSTLRFSIRYYLIDTIPCSYGMVCMKVWTIRINTWSVHNKFWWTTKTELNYSPARAKL
jgi:hypothetical protein